MLVQLPYISYDGIQRTYIPDFYLVDENKIVEIKSSYTIDENTKIKLETCKRMGYNTEIVVYD